MEEDPGNHPDNIKVPDGIIKDNLDYYIPEFVKDDGLTNADTQNKLFAHMILTGETTSKRLSLANLLDRGLKGAPMGAVNLSKKEMKDLLVYINENF